jgi:phosphatidate cytidylyltransferase
MSTFLTRTVTALFFVVIMLAGILWSAASFFFLFLLISLLALQEYFSLAGRIRETYARIDSLHRLLVMLTGLSLFLLTAGKHFTVGAVSAGLIGRWLLPLSAILLLLCELLKGKDFRIINTGLSLLGLLYTVVPFCLLMQLRLEHSYHDLPLIPLILIGSIWVNDTMAYIVGSLIGRTKFFPSISPRKTWEGTLGGILLTLLAAGLFGHFTSYYPAAEWLVIGGLAAIVGTAGDLLESRLKRMAGVKDSGSIMPGHGGFLDRFDSLIVATPFVWLYACFFL